MTDKHAEAIEAIKLAHEMSRRFYDKPLTVCYSGGKDSDAILRLCIESGVPFEVEHSLTTADAPETVYHVLRRFGELEDAGYMCTVKHPVYKGERTSMWDLIPQKQYPPTRLARYCCKVLKENSSQDRFKVFGIRFDESNARRSRNTFEYISKKKDGAQRWDMPTAREVFEESKALPEVYDCNLITHAKNHDNLCVNPIGNWSTQDVFDYADEQGIELNPLYEKGFSRVGCVMCPLGGTASMRREAAAYPKYRRAYVRAFDRMLDTMRAKGKTPTWTCGEDVYSWWVDDGMVYGQKPLFEIEEVKR